MRLMSMDCLLGLLAKGTLEILVKPRQCSKPAHDMESNHFSVDDTIYAPLSCVPRKTTIQNIENSGTIQSSTIHIPHDSRQK